MPKSKLEFQYYYKVSGCPATSSKGSDCICWHTEGTGPVSKEKHTDETPLVEWRIKPKAK